LPWLSLAVSLALVAYGALSRITDRWEQLGYGFILGGAFGNGIDRLLAGYVVDFIQAFPVTRFPVFNLADIWINVGIACLFLAFLFNPDGKSQKRNHRR
jgi:signal peptidase II